MPACLYDYYFNDFFPGEKSRERNLLLTIIGRDSTVLVFEVFI